MFAIKEGVNVVSQIIPIEELKNTNAIFEKCSAMTEPLFISKNGKCDLVVMSMEVYEGFLDSASIDFAIRESESERVEGAGLIDAREALRALRRKYND